MKSVDRQAKAVTFRARSLGQTAQATDQRPAPASWLKYGVVAPPSAHHVKHLAEKADAPGIDLPETARDICVVVQITDLSPRSGTVEKSLRNQASDEVSARLRSIPVEPVTAMAIDACAPPLDQIGPGGGTCSAGKPSPG